MPPPEYDMVDVTNINEPSKTNTSDSMGGNIEEDVLLLTSGKTTDLRMISRIKSPSTS
jgi:hypothetical protein